LALTDRMDGLEFTDIPVAPYAELLDSTRGLSDHRGGPVFDDWDAHRHARHCRRDWQPVDVQPAVPTGPIPRLQGCRNWMGPVCHHFGHQLADLSMRILPAMETARGEASLAALRVGSQPDLVSTPAFFRDILAWFGVDPARVRLVHQPVCVERLWVMPQSEMIFGPPPGNAWLAVLERHFRRRASGCAPSGAARIVYVTRSAVTRGTIAGESAVEEYLRGHGALVVRPEDHGLAELLPLYAAAEHVVLSEGSAMHALQFMGRQLRHVTVIGRGQSHRYGANFLTARCESLQHIEVPVRGLSGRTDGRFRETGLALLDGPKLAQSLAARLGLGGASWNEQAWQRAQAESVWRWVRDYLHARPHKTPLSPEIISRELKDSELHTEPALQTLLKARERQDAADQRGPTSRLPRRSSFDLKRPRPPCCWRRPLKRAPGSPTTPKSCTCRWPTSSGAWMMASCRTTRASGSHAAAWLGRTKREGLTTGFRPG
jgi:hypothetical protein